MLSINQIALSEGVVLGRKLGIEPSVLLRAINSSSGALTFLLASVPACLAVF